MKTGFIGMGIMGSRMAGNLRKAGHDLSVWNRTRENASGLLARGATWSEDPAGLAGRSDVLVTMLSTPEAVRAVALGPGGFLLALRPGSLWIDSTTVFPAFSREMAEAARSRGVRFLDAPVSGSLVPAEKGELIFLVGGDSKDLEDARPLLDAMGKKVIHAGPHGTGASLKLVFNLLLGFSMLGFSEALRLGASLGLPRDLLLETLPGSPVAAPFLTNKRDRIRDGVYSPEFPLKWMRKDLHFASMVAYESGIALPGLNAVKEVFALAAEAGHADEDFAAVHRFAERLKTEG